MDPIQLLGVNVVVDDLEAMVDFLVGMGFELVSDSILDGPWLDSILRTENSQLNYLQFAGPYGGGQINLLKYLNPERINPAVDPTVPYAGQIRMISLLCENMAEAFQLAQDLGATRVGTGTQVAGDFRVGYVLGPDNVLFMLMQVQDWRDNLGQEQGNHALAE